MAMQDLTPWLFAAEGHLGPVIAERLVVSPATVKSHFQNIYAKLGGHPRKHMDRTGPQLPLKGLELLKVSVRHTGGKHCCLCCVVESIVGGRRRVCPPFRAKRVTCSDDGEYRDGTKRGVLRGQRRADRIEAVRQKRSSRRALTERGRCGRGRYDVIGATRNVQRRWAGAPRALRKCAATSRVAASAPSG